jgi:hypothetical protein
VVPTTSGMLWWNVQATRLASRLCDDWLCVSVPVDCIVRRGVARPDSDAAAVRLAVSLSVTDATFWDCVAGGNGGVMFWQAAAGVMLSLWPRPGSPAVGYAVGGGGGGLYVDRANAVLGGSLTVAGGCHV